MLEQLVVEDVRAEDEGVLAFRVPAPAVERADEAVLGAVALAVRQLHAAVAAGVVDTP